MEKEAPLVSVSRGRELLSMEIILARGGACSSKA
jgi:hypothetical protein